MSGRDMVGTCRTRCFWHRLARRLACLPVLINEVPHLVGFSDHQIPLDWVLVSFDPNPSLNETVPCIHPLNVMPLHAYHGGNDKCVAASVSRYNFETRVGCVCSASGQHFHQRKILRWCHCNYACASFFCKPPPHCAFVTLVVVFIFLYNVAASFCPVALSRTQAACGSRSCHPCSESPALLLHCSSVQKHPCLGQ